MIRSYRLMAWGVVLVLLSLACTLGCAHGARPAMECEAGPGYQPDAEVAE
jgi:hypothetical protein